MTKFVGSVKIGRKTYRTTARGEALIGCAWALLTIGILYGLMLTLYVIAG